MGDAKSNPGLLSWWFLVGIAATLSGAIAGGLGDILEVPALGLLQWPLRLLGLTLAAMGGLRVARWKGRSAILGVVCGITWPIGILILLSLNSKAEGE